MSSNCDFRPNTANGQYMHHQFIDYLKVLAFSTVVIAHQFSEERNTFFLTSVFNIRLFHPIEVFLTGGGGGVSLFFIISGYLITKSMQRETPIQFLVRRTLRIFPLYWFAIVAYLVKDRTPIRYSDSIGAFTLMGDFWNSMNILWGVDWTLRIEILFYIFGLLVLVLSQTYLNARRMYPLYTTSLLVAAFLIPEYPTGWASAYPSIFIPLFALGTVCAIHETKRRSILTSAGIIIPLLVSVVNAKRYRPDLIDTGFITYLLMAVVFFLTGWLFRNKISSVSPIHFLANIAYPVYLFHNLLLPSISQITIKPLALVLTIFFCWLSSILIERPFIKLSRRLTRAT